MCNNACMSTKENINTQPTSFKTQIQSLRTNKTFLVCCFLCVAYLISGYWKWIEIGVSLSAIIFMAFLPLQSSFCIFMFLHNFTLSNIGYDSCFMVSLIGYCLILLIKYWVGVKNGKYVFYKKLVITIGLFYIITTIISFFKPFYMGAWLYFTYLPLAYFLFAMREDFDIAQGMNYMFGGMLAGCGLSALALFFPGYEYEIILQGRFRAFINCTNYLYMRAVFVLAYYMYRHLNDNISNTNFLIIMCLCAMITFITLSKTGIAILALMIFIYVIMALKQDFKRRIKFLAVAGSIFIIVCLIFSGFIMKTINRFMEATTSADAVNSLLTHRDVLWVAYIKEIFSSPLKFLFGHGMLHSQIYFEQFNSFTETHNFYLFLLHRFGLFGSIALGYIVYLFIKTANREKPKAIAYLPLIFILIESFCDNTFKCYNFTYFIFAVMILFMNCKPKSENKGIKEKQQKN